MFLGFPRNYGNEDNGRKGIHWSLDFINKQGSASLGGIGLITALQRPLRLTKTCSPLPPQLVLSLSVLGV